MGDTPTTPAGIYLDPLYYNPDMIIDTVKKLPIRYSLIDETGFQILKRIRNVCLKLLIHILL